MQQLQTILLIIGIISPTQGLFKVFRGASEQELELMSNLEKLAVAAKVGESHVIELSGASQSAVVQEAVNLNIDCLPWLLRYPGGSIRWKMIQLDEFHNIRGPPEQLEPNEDLMPVPRIVVGGEFNQWLNITRTVIIQGAEDPDRKIFMCEVCIARDTPFEICHTSNYTSLLIGSPPIILQSSATFCRLPGEIAILQCDVRNIPPIPLPTPSRSWFRNDVQIYSAILGEAPDATDFFMNNTILMLGILEPQVFTLSTDGSVALQTDVSNITLPGFIPEIGSIEEAEQVLYDLLLGTWTCEASNNLGTARVMYTIRACVSITEDAADPIAGQDYSLVCNVSRENVITPYVWRRNNLVLENKTTAVLSFSPLKLSDAGSYTCEITVNNHAIISSAVDVTIATPQPTVTLVLDKPNPILSGLPLTLTCAIEPNPGVDIPLNVNTLWSGPNERSTLSSSMVKYYSPTRYLSSATINHVDLADSGVYSCTVKIEGLDDVSASTSVTIVDGMFQLSLKSVGICEQCNSKMFSDSDLVMYRLSHFIKLALVEAIQRRCKCHFPIINLLKDSFRCDSSDILTYLNALLGTHNFNGTQIIGFIQDWVNTNPSIKIGRRHIRVDSSCPVAITSMDELSECSSSSESVDQIGGGQKEVCLSIH